MPFRPPAIVLILLAGLALRLLIAYVLFPGEGLGSDLRLFGRWAQVLVDFGPGGFYSNAGFADYPPGYLWILWLVGLLGNAIAGLIGQSPADVIPVLLKLPAMLADVAIAYLLYRTAVRWRAPRAGLIAAALFLFIPATWYDSALWGQIDSVGSLLLLGAILLLIEGWGEPAVALGILATVTKPQYGIGLVVIAAVLLGRHLVRRGTGPVPKLRGWLAVLDRRLGGWFTSQRGFRRLIACAAVGAVVGILAILPFDLPIKGPVEFWDVPVVGHIAGLVAVVSAAASYYSVLTVNAFNIWALVGPTPLSHALGHDYIWTYDSVSVLGDITAVTIGQGLLAIVAITVVTALLVRDDRRMIWIGFTVLAVAFFAVPTRVHERYLFPALVTGALLAATSTRWRWWYVLLGLACVANLHAILTLNYPGYGTFGVQSLPLGDFLRDDPAVIVVAITNTALFVGVFVAFVREVPWVAVARAARAPFRFVVDPIRARLASGLSTDDQSDALATEGGGHIDRRDLVLAALLIVLILGMRTFRLGTPPTLYFDEIFHARTAMEFLQDWRYGIPHDLYETTHPHVAKYIVAGGIVALGDNRVTGTAEVGAPVVDVAVEPAFVDSSAPGGLGGDRLAIATGDGVRIALHGAIDSASALALPGAVAVGFDSAADRLYIGTQDGGLWVLGGPALAALDGRIAAPAPIKLTSLEGSVRHIWAVGNGRVAVATANDELIIVGGDTGAVVASAQMAGLTALVPLPIEGKSLAIAALPSGLREVDTSNLAPVAELSFSSRPGGAVLLDGSDFLHRNREMLSVPTLYVATAGSRVETVTIGPSGELTAAGGFPMPGPVSDVRWDRPTNLVHVLGTGASGQPTVYVVEPNSNAVFADAELPFEPVAWALDVEPNAPGLDRQRGLAFSPNGSMAIVDVGSNAFAWRFPGVVAGALTMGLLFLLTRLLFRRRTVGYLLAIMLALDGLLFAQSRIAMNDTYVALFIVAAFTLLAWLLRQAVGGRRARLGMLLGLPFVGILLGLALGTKWVGAYAMGGALLIVLFQSRIGRRTALEAMVLLTAIFGYQALAGTPANYVFPVIMVGLTLLLAVAIVRVERATAVRESTARTGPSWTDPTRMFGLPFAWAFLWLAILPLAVYVVTYVPWALTAGGNPQLLAGWPPGHTGQTFLDLQVDMYRYHNEFRTPHGASSPWWAWPFDLKPIWGYYETFVDGSGSIIMGVGNPILMWLAVPAVAFGAWQAWRRRSAALLFVLVAFAALWLPWARIDRVAFNYHFYTALPFAFILLAYFLAELWHGPSRQTWSLARIAFAFVLMAPALLWIWRDPLCAVSGVATMDPTAFACTRPLSDVALPVGIWFVASLAAAFFIFGARRPRRLVVVILGTAAVAFLALYPGLAAWPLPPDWGLAFQGLLPSWDGTFLFSSNTAPASDIPLLGIGPLVLLIVVVVLVWSAMRRAGGQTVGRGPWTGGVSRGGRWRKPSGSRPTEIGSPRPVQPHGGPADRDRA